MSDRMEAMKNRGESFEGNTGALSNEEKDRRRIYRTVKQAHAMTTANAVEGGMKAGAGALNVTGNAMTLSGIAALPGTIVSSIGTGVDVASGFVADYLKKGVRTDTVNEEINLDEKIKALMAQDNSITEKEAKHIVLKSMGFSSGKRKEAFQHITMRRAANLLNMASSTNETEAKEAREILSELGLRETGSGYSLQGIAEKLGMDVEEALASLSGPRPALIAAVIVLAALALSVLISLGIYRRKEF